MPDKLFPRSLAPSKQGGGGGLENPMAEEKNKKEEPFLETLKFSQVNNVRFKKWIFQRKVYAKTIAATLYFLCYDLAAL